MSMRKDVIEEHPISSLGIVLHAAHSFVFVGIRIARRLFLSVGSFSIVQDNMAEAMLV